MASAIICFTLRTGSVGCMTRRLGIAATCVTGAKSRIGSYGTFL